MWPRLTLEDVRVVAHYTGYLIVFLAIAMVVPLAISVANHDTAITTNYLFSMGIALIVGFLLCMCKINPTNLKRKQAVVITALAWLVCSLVAAIPLFLSGHYVSYFDSVFESMSGFTTSGFSLCVDMEHMSTSDTVWRFIMHFIGGQGVIVIAMSIGAFARSGSRAALYDAEGRHDHVMPEIRQTTLFIVKFSVVVIVISAAVMTVLLLVKGLTAPDAILHGTCLTIAAYDTAGFSLTSAGMPYYHSWALEVVCMFVMIIGAISFSLYYRLLNGRIRDFFKDFELRSYAVWIIVVVAFVTIALCAGDHINGLNALLRKGVFTVISAGTSTGAQVIPPEQMTGLVPTGAIFMVAIAMAVGGMSESMAGGMKALRLGIVAKEIILRIKQVLSPDSARMVSTYEHLGRKVISKDAAASALVIVALFLGSIMIGAAITMAFGYEPSRALFESVSASCNNGLSSGIIAPGMPTGLEIMYFIQMWFGRLEFLTVLACIFALFTSLAPKPKKRRG